MANNGQITKRELIENDAIQWPEEYAQNLGVAISAQEALKKSAKEINGLLNAYRSAGSNSNLVSTKKAEAAVLAEVSQSLKNQELAFVNLNKIVQDNIAATQKSTAVAVERARVSEESKNALNQQTLAHKQSINAIKEEESAEIAAERIKREKLKTDKLAETQARQTAGAVRGEKDAYGEMSSELNKLFRQTASVAVQLYRLKEAGQAGSPEFERLTGRFTELRAETLKLDTELKKIDASLGRNQRNVGNYKFDSLGNSIQQILREAPSAAVSLNTFFLAISNNLPAFFDSFQQIQRELKDLKDVATQAASSLAAQTAVQNEATIAAGAAQVALNNNVNATLSKIGVDEKSAQAISAQVKAQVAEIDALGVATAETVANTQAMLLNAGASQEQVASIQASIIANGEATAARVASTASLNAQTLAAEEANVALAAQPSVMARVGKSLLSLNTFLTLGVLALTLFGGDLFKLIGGLLKGEESLSSFARAAKELSKIRIDAAKATYAEITQLKTYAKIAADVVVPMEKRRIAAQKLIDLYPEEYKALGEQKILLGQVADANERVTKTLVARATSEAALTKITENAGKIIDLNEQQRISVEKLSKAEENLRRIQNRSVAASNAENAAQNEAEAIGKVQNLKLKQQKTQIEINKLEADNARLSQYYYDETIKSLTKETQLKEKQILQLENVKSSERDLAKARLQIQADLNKNISENESLTYEQRIAATTNYYAIIDRINKISLEQQKENLNKAVKDEIAQIQRRIRNEEVTSASGNARIKSLKQKLNNDLLTADQNYEGQRLQVHKQGEDALDNLFISDFNKQLKDKEDANTQLLNVDLIRENERFNNQKITYTGREAALEEHERNILEIKKAYAIRGLQQDIKAFEEVLKLNDSLPENERINAIERADIAQKLSDKKVELSNLTTRTDLDNGDKTVKSEEEQAEKIRELRNQLGEELVNLANTLFDRKIQKIDDELSALEGFYSKQLELAGDDESQRELIEQEYEKKRQALEKKKREEQRKQAIFNKAIQASQVIQQTSLAIISTLAQVPKFDFGISAGTIAALYASIGAVQLANVLATPIPKYRHGRKGGKAELAQVGDGGVQEVIESKDGSIKITPSKPTYAWLNEGDSVHSSKQAYQKYIAQQTMASIRSENEKVARHNNSVSGYDDRQLKDAIEKSIEKGFKKAIIINNIPAQKFDINHQLWAMQNKKW